jgi:hypothetical protein
MRIKKFENFSGDEPYVEVGISDHVYNYRYNTIPLDGKDLFFILNNIKANKDSLVYYYEIDDRYHNSVFEFTSPEFAYKRLLGRDVAKIIMDTANISISKDDDDYYWVGIQFNQKYKCDELSGLKELLKDLNLYKDDN